jgi:hypothetical protein
MGRCGPSAIGDAPAAALEGEATRMVERDAHATGCGRSNSIATTLATVSTNPTRMSALPIRARIMETQPNQTGCCRRQGVLIVCAVGPSVRSTLTEMRRGVILSDTLPRTLKRVAFGQGAGALQRRSADHDSTE